MAYYHIPVMVQEVIAYLNVRPGKTYVDCTLGGSGHGAAIVEHFMPGGFLVGMDQDKDAIEYAKRTLSDHASQVALFQENFVNIGMVLSQLGIDRVDGIFADLGVSFYQLAQSGRGFSFQRDEPLDMRMDQSSEITAEDIVNSADQRQLSDIFFKYGEERWSKRIASNILKARKTRRIKRTSELSEIVADSIPKKFIAYPQRIHPATRVFMALRIAVNRELERLEFFMDTAADLLNPGGRLCFLSFHSLEDRIVKHRIKALEKGCTCPSNFPQCVCEGESKLRFLTRKPVVPTQQEIDANPMSRSTKLRAAERL